MPCRNLNTDIEKVYEVAKAAYRTNEIWKDDKKVIDLLCLCKEIYYSQIYEYCKELNNNAGELMIRKYIRQIVKAFLPMCETKIKESRKKGNLENLNIYLGLYDDFYAMASYRSLKHFVQYMEFDKSLDKKLWLPTMHLLGGFWYYANSMILDKDVQFISKQCFTGLGKTYSNAFLLAFIYGLNVNDDALYVFGASANVGKFALSLIDLMASPRYAKVFPYYKQFQEETKDASINSLFSIKRVADTGSELRIAGSDSPMNLVVVSKAKDTNGLRAKFLFLDDITQAADANSLVAHKRDIHKLETEWYKRNYDLNNFFIIAGGTTYSVDDILMHLLSENNFADARLSFVNKFTYTAKSDYVVSGGTSVFVRIPKLDYVTDESTYPEKYPTEIARKKRDNAKDGGRMFAAMEQQMPYSSIDNPFDWGNLHLYDEIPEEEGTYRFILDPSRKGNDKTCCLFFKQIRKKHYLIDAFIDKQPLDYKYPSGKTVLETICDKIVAHRCLEGSAEENTESTIRTQIKNILAEKQFLCKVDSYYSWKIKKDKIYAAQTCIIENIYFPSRKVFAANSEVGHAMQDITYWKYKDNIDDDAPECCANYANTYINNPSMRLGVASVFKR